MMDMLIPILYLIRTHLQIPPLTGSDHLLMLGKTGGSSIEQEEYVGWQQGVGGGKGGQ